jgi:hypothetical protein
MHQSNVILLLDNNALFLLDNILLKRPLLQPIATSILLLNDASEQCYVTIG